MPSYPQLTHNLKTTLINGVNKIQYEDYIVHYHINGDVKFPDEFPAAYPETISKINSKIDALTNVPNPEESDHWNHIVLITEKIFVRPLSECDKIDINNAIKEVGLYVKKWSTTKPKNNHLDEAAVLLHKLNAMLVDIDIEFERKEWDAVNKFNYDSIIDYLRHHPKTPFLNEADTFLWDIVRTSRPLKKFIIKRYMNDAVRFVLSHIVDAEEMLKQFDEWEKVQKAATWRNVFKYTQDYPDSMFKEDAQDLLDELVGKELEKMKKNPAPYPHEDCKYLVDNDLISKYTLMGEKLITEDSFERMMNLAKFREENTIPDPKGNYFDDFENEDITDIFLFGIPGTGKTSVLMGLLKPGKFHFESIVADGDYGETLQNYVNHGYMPPQTLENFVSVCKGFVRDSKGIKHPVNIIDMAGEDFARKIAKNEKCEISFANMGHTATKLLTSKHRKIFFVILDPVNNKVILQRKVFDDLGQPVGYENITLYQDQTINRLINLFCALENKTIMERVDGIHFLMTKADTLEIDGSGRERKALEKINSSLYENQVRELKVLCNKANLDLPTPRLFLFSLGKFYVGNVFDSNSKDADTILDMVAGGSKGIANGSIWSKIEDFLNKPLF